MARPVRFVIVFGNKFLFSFSTTSPSFSTNFFALLTSRAYDDPFESVMVIIDPFFEVTVNGCGL